MKRQYLGDVNDYRKYHILRHLAGEGRLRIGVCWMLTPDDQRRDGRKIDYLSDPAKWRRYDPVVFDLLASMVGRLGQRLLERIEQSVLIPEALYFDEMISDQCDHRRACMGRMLKKFSDVDLIFFDPDNGIEVKSKPAGRKASCKYLYWDEIENTAREGHSLLIYQHFARQKRDQFVAAKAERLFQRVGASAVWAIRTSHVVFLLAAAPAHHVVLAGLIKTMEGRFPDMRVVECF